MYYEKQIDFQTVRQKEIKLVNSRDHNQTTLEIN